MLRSRPECVSMPVTMPTSSIKRRCLSAGLLKSICRPYENVALGSASNIRLRMSTASCRSQRFASVSPLIEKSCGASLDGSTGVLRRLCLFSSGQIRGLRMHRSWMKRNNRHASLLRTENAKRVPSMEEPRMSRSNMPGGLSRRC